MKRNNEHKGWACSIWMPICGAFFTIFGIGLTYGAISLYDEMGGAIFAIPSIVCFFAIMFWLNTIFGRLAVKEYGILFKGSVLLQAGILYSFEKIARIKVRGRAVCFKYGKWGLLSSPGWILVRDPEGFIKAVERYAPGKLEIK
ncbi:MAG: hypothetical protein IB616_02930 [Methanosarcinales archaeon]|nr:MAG: hypothetical protein IB616_02930 [Methanosarcinales archaeon]